MEASASIMSLTSMTEVVVRNALDRALSSWAARKSAGSDWFDIAPLDQQGKKDVVKARDRATLNGKRPERHGKVVAELTLGFWRFLIEMKYFTQLWVPATHSAFSGGPADLRDRQRAVKDPLQRLTLVRSRAAHHERIHRRDLLKDLEAGVQLAGWVLPDAGAWPRAKSSVERVAATKPTPE